MAKTTTPKAGAKGAADSRLPSPELNTEVAHRLVDPFETNFMGVLQTADPLLMERGENAWRLYRDLMRDGEVYRGFQKRVSALVRSPWQVEPVTKSAKGTADAQRVTDILKASGYDQFCRHQMKALICGWSVSEVVWRVWEGWIAPARLVPRAIRRFVYVQDDPQRPPELRLLTRENMLKGEELPERKFIAHRINSDDDDNPYGLGLGLQLYFAVYFKRRGIVGWNKASDRVGTPTPWGRYPRGASQKEKDTLFAALKAFSSDGVVMTPEGTAIELLEAALASGTPMHQGLCEYMDDWIAGVLTGREPRTNAGGALAAASKERSAVSLDLTQADSDLQSETHNETLLKWICEYNGFEPCVISRVVKEEEDLKAAAETDTAVSAMGFELDINAVRARYGEGWNKKVAAPAPAGGPPMPAPPRPPAPGQPPGGDEDPRGGEPASFAEAPPADPIVRDLAKAGNAIVEGWMQRIGALVQQHSEPQALRDAILAAYGDLDTRQLVELMELAFTLAQLQGMDAVASQVQGAGNGNGG